MNENQAVDSVGYFSPCPLIAAWFNGSQKSENGVWLNRCALSSPDDWVMHV